ncbi:MAG: DUF1080 domain-containing protein, partial [Anaerolineae bacterium]
FLANRSGNDETPPIAGGNRDVPAAAPGDNNPQPAVPPELPPAAFLPPVPQCSAGETELFFDDFEDGNLNGWDLSDVNGQPSTNGWSVTQQGNNHVLAGQGHNWAVAQATFGQDYVLHLRVRQGAAANWHLNVRMGENGRYYVSPESLHRDPDTIELARWPGQPDDAWHIISIMAKGNHLEVFWDGRQVAAADDPEPLKAGVVALENTGGAVWYDDIRVCALPAAGPAADAPAPPSAQLHFV